MADLNIRVSTGSGPAISVNKTVSMTHVAARKGFHSLLGERAQAAWGVPPPDSPRIIEFAGGMIVWTGPDQWLVLGPAAPGSDQSSELTKLFNGLASVVDVSDSRVIFRVSTSRPPAGLQRSMPIDFHDQVFGRGDVAVTQAAHLGFVVWRLPNGEGYEFACARTYAKDFSEWLARACR